MWLYLRPDAVTVWDNPEVRKRLSWYYRVMRNERPARFIICRHVPVEEDPKQLAVEELWRVHDEACKAFWDLYEEVREGRELKGAKPRWSLLDVKAELAWRILESCCFCERRCGVNRAAGERGFCRLADETIVTSWFHHYGEEAPLVPSGTIFYGSCNFRCVFCQNYSISQVNPFDGVRVDGRRLAAMQRELREGGARNINHVGGEPTPNLHTILDSLRYLRVNVPQLWNSNMYCSLEAMKLLREVIDIWLPDLKYGDDRCARRLSLVDRYWEVVTRNIKMAHDSADIIIRHLVMPNHLECCTRPILEWIADNCPRALVNVMEQYRPMYLVPLYPDKYADINRRPTYEEIRKAYEMARSLGIVFEPVS